MHPMHLQDSLEVFTTAALSDEAASTSAATSDKVHVHMIVWCMLQSLTVVVSSAMPRKYTPEQYETELLIQMFPTEIDLIS